MRETTSNQTKSYTQFTNLEANPFLGADPLSTATQVTIWQATRKTAIEPILICSVNSCQSQARINLYRCELCLMLPPFWTGHLAVTTRNVKKRRWAYLRETSRILKLSFDEVILSKTYKYGKIKIYKLIISVLFFYERFSCG